MWNSESVNDTSSDSEETSCEVEKIVGWDSEGDGSLIFKIKWKGYDESDNSWVREKDLNCDELLNEYLEEMNAEAMFPDAPLAKAAKNMKRKLTVSPSLKLPLSHTRLNNYQYNKGEERTNISEVSGKMINYI